MRRSNKKYGNYGFALLSGIFATALGFFILVVLQIYETASIEGGGMVARAQDPIIITAYAIAGFIYGRRRGHSIGFSLAAISPIIITVAAVLVTVTQIEISRLIAGNMTFILLSLAAHWLASYAGWKSTKGERRGEASATPE